VRGKEATEGSYKVDVDPNELLFWLAPAMGQTASADISSLTDGTVWRHTLNPFCRIGSLSVEQAK